VVPETPLPGPPRTSAPLVVVVVIDQLPSWALERYAPLFEPASVLRMAMSNGAYYEEGEYDYAGTYTAPGHATLYTGVLPNQHGVAANEVWDEARSHVESVVDDGRHEVFGAPGQFASPDVLRAPTVADELERETGGRARTVSISLKDRAAVLPGGKAPDLALFYDAKRGAFTTSSYYAKSLPDWLVRFQTEHPLSARLGPWRPSDTNVLENWLGPDAAPGEGNWLGLGSSFPHDPSATKDPLLAARITPFATDYLFDLARECIRALELGRDDAPDLLMISVSSVDYAGHTFGPESWEYVDSLIRADHALGQFLGNLAWGGLTAAPVRVLVTSDHGVAPLPERARDSGHLAFRVTPKKVAEAVNLALAGRFSLKTPAVASYTEPFVYLSPEAKSSPAYPEILAAVAREVGTTPGIGATFSVRELLARSPTSELERLVRASVPDDAVADVFVVPAEYSVVDPSLPGGSGTSHGSPWTYDRHVPILFWGPGVTRHHETGPVSTLRVAPTLAALLGVRPPETASPAALAGVPEAAP
jgi:predicted AlkP superfamily pyrophosphatase or phosphodiesterase